MGVSCSLTLAKVADSADIASNTSKITVKLTATTTGESHNSNSPSGSITIDGVKYTYSKDLPYTSTVTLYSATKTITHNSDGNKSVKVSYSFNTGISAGTLTGSKTIVLDRINRGLRIKFSGSYKRALVYVKDQGSYKLAIPYVKTDGTYKLGAG